MGHGIRGGCDLDATLTSLAGSRDVRRRLERKRAERQRRLLGFVRCDCRDGAMCAVAVADKQRLGAGRPFRACDDCGSRGPDERGTYGRIVVGLRRR